MFNIFKKTKESIDRTREKTKQSLERTREALTERISDVFDRAQFDDSLWDELEEVLIAADVGMTATMKIVEGTRARVKEEKIKDAPGVQMALGKEMIQILQSSGEESASPSDGPEVILVVGVNGTGKTTSIAKLAHSLKQEGKHVMLAAGDTFRAAAIDQLKYWGARLAIDVIASQPGGDPGAVVFDALEAAKKRKSDILIVDTAGRIQTKSNLMEELKKVRRIIGRSDIQPQVLLVLDANTGQNGLSQARYFTEAVDVDGIVLAKLDSTSKGGIVLAVADELKIPILFIGTGQEPDDLAPFNAEEFVEALLAR
ncbi:MAG: signal recognition particle-docking protein FtsY [Chloroflexota bacterium]|nr:signal recognition particle-docking protein FtsY [Chloroflexota bacterium]